MEICHVFRESERKTECRDKVLRGKKTGGFLHPPVLEKQRYRFSLFDVGTDNRCHLHHVDRLTFFQVCKIS